MVMHANRPESRDRGVRAVECYLYVIKTTLCLPRNLFEEFVIKLIYGEWVVGEGSGHLFRL